MKSLRYSKTRHLQRGVTLPELLIVIFLLGIFTFSGMHSWHNYQQTLRLEASAHQLLAFLTRIQNEANWHNSEISLWIKSYPTWCISRGIPPRKCKIGNTDIFTPPYADILLFESTVNKITFNGLRNTARSSHITLANSSGKIKVMLSSQGRLRLCNEDVPFTGIPQC